MQAEEERKERGLVNSEEIEDWYLSECARLREEKASKEAAEKRT